MNHAHRALLSPLSDMGGGTAARPPVLTGDTADDVPPPQPTTTSGSGRYVVDVERAPQAIADLRRAADALEAEAVHAQDLADIKPPGLDAVSANAVRVFCEAAVGGQGSLRLALEGAVRRLRADADALEADLKAYLQVDEISLPPAHHLTLHQGHPDGPRCAAHRRRHCCEGVGSNLPPLK